MAARVCRSPGVGDGVHGKSLETAEAEIQPRAIGHGPWKAEPVGVAVLRQGRQLRAARIGKAEKAGGFVEGLTGGIIQRLAERPVRAYPFDRHQLRMSPGHQQRQKGKFRGIRLQHRRQQVPFHVMHGHRRHPPGESQAAAHGGPHQQRAYQPRPGGIGDAVDAALCSRTTGGLEHLVQQRHQLSHVVPGGELRHHAAILGVRGRLAVKQVPEQAGLAVEYGDPGLVAGCLDSQYSHRRSRAGPARVPIDTMVIRLCVRGRSQLDYGVHCCGQFNVTRRRDTVRNIDAVRPST